MHLNISSPPENSETVVGFLLDRPMAGVNGDGSGNADGVFYSNFSIAFVSCGVASDNDFYIKWLLLTHDFTHSDARALRTVLSLTGLKEGLKGHIVVELGDLDNEVLVKLVGGELVETVVAHDVIGRLMIQCARHSRGVRRSTVSREPSGCRCVKMAMRGRGGRGLDEGRRGRGEEPVTADRRWR
ncbi:hypothetical protein L2E82_39257 [Cichorium intybus]|uniref:Uncharacterized protein n=1 Tax=Cichorium intybus TaxID=13427 RepID=A0ACB9AM38_CICIN|nr:hypothetical protein L2E82_39257 [Cichorium intybus]